MMVEREMIYHDTETLFSSAMRKAWSILSPDFLDRVQRHKRCLDKMVVQSRDSLFSQ